MLEENPGPRPASSIVPIACRLLEVLDAGHADGIVHGDVRPANVLLQPDGELRLLNFGIARRLFLDGRVLGDPAYLAPEQARSRGEHADVQSDVWGVGAILFRALSGRLVVDASSRPLALVRAAIAAPPKLSVVAPEVRPQLATVVDLALAVRKSERWPSARAMLRALRAVPLFPSAPRSGETLRAVREPVDLRLVARTTRGKG